MIHAPKLLGELVLRRVGVPAVVLCGGPSVTSFDANDLAGDTLLFSANAHGAKLVGERYGFGVDYIVSVDNIHTETKEPMEPMLRQYGVPIISPQFWADYRLHDWGFAGNSGMQAIYVAWLMGCSPIVVFGMDCYATGTYWHNPNLQNISSGRNASFFLNKLRSLHNLCGSDHIRVAGHSLAGQFFPPYNPAERMPVVIPTPHQIRRADPKTVILRMECDRDFNKARLKAGELYEFTVGEAEAIINRRQGRVWTGNKASQTSFQP